MHGCSIVDNRPKQEAAVLQSPSIFYYSIKSTVLWAQRRRSKPINKPGIIFIQVN